LAKRLQLCDTISFEVRLVVGETLLEIGWFIGVGDEKSRL
jgi:hypothetical protein